MSDLSNFPSPLLETIELCADEYYRYGVISKCRMGKVISNVSLIYSILFCIDNRFLNIVDKEKQIYISKVVDHFLLEFDRQYKEHEYRRLGWTKKDIREELQNYTNSNIVVQYIANYFNINIFVLEWAEPCALKAVYSDEEFSKYKPSIILSLQSNVFEPIITNEVRFFSNKDHLIKTIINSPKIEILNPKKKLQGFDKKFVIGMEDLDQYLPKAEEEEEEKEEEKEKDDDDEDDEEDADDDEAEVEGEGEAEVDANDEEINNIKDKDKNKDEDEDEKNTNFYDDSVTNNEDVSESEEEVTDDEDGDGDNNDIFCKTKTKNSSNVKKFKLSPSIKLADLQKIAKKCKIDIYTLEKTKNGKFKSKTKSQLKKEIPSSH